MELEFYGATERVTGSCHIIRTKQATILLDCGLIQGSSDEEQLNLQALMSSFSVTDILIIPEGFPCSYSEVSVVQSIPMRQRLIFAGFCCLIRPALPNVTLSIRESIR